jgi:methyl-accepting chemotaxis protein
MKIKGKLFSMLLLPVLGMFCFSAYLLWGKAALVQETEKLGILSGFNATAGALMHELQKERGMSAGHIGSKGEKFVKELPGQRATTDKKLADLQTYLARHPEIGSGAKVAAAIDDALKDIERLAATRKAVSALGIPASAAADYYTDVIAALARIMNELAGQSPDPSITRMLLTHVNFVLAKEHTGQERALLSGVFAQDKFPPGLYEKFVSVVARQESYADTFFKMALPRQVDLYTAKMKDKAMEESARLRAIALDRHEKGNFGVDSVVWFNAISGKINLMKEVEDGLTDDMRVETALLASGAQRSLWAIVAVTLISLGAALAMAFYMLRGITRQVGALHETLGKIEKDSDVSLRVEILSGDEIGATARALNAMLDKFHKSMTQVTESTAHLATASEELSAVTEETRQGVTRQQTETDQAAVAMNEMSSTAQEIARNASGAAEAARLADEASKNGQRVAHQTIEAINTLAQEVEEAADVIHKLEADSTSIGKVLDVIRGIAEQTNLLALNAAIEAARAGEQGRGFAVVADEVRTLASRTQQSTQEIQQMIERLQTGADNAVQVMMRGRTQAQTSVQQVAQTGASLEAITRAVSSITDMNTQIASAAEEQSAVAEEINRGIVSISQIGGQTAAGARQTATASEELARLAAQLQTLVGQFRL